MHVLAASEDIWDSCIDGDPRRVSKLSKTGNAIVSFTSGELYWVEVALRSTLQHFSKAKLIVATPGWPKDADGIVALSLAFLWIIVASQALERWLNKKRRSLQFLLWARGQSKFK